MGQSDSVTVITARTVKPGREADFERALHEFVQRTLALPGQQGVHIMRPAPQSGSREYGIVRKFATREAVERFHSSEEYREWSRRVAGLTEGAGRAEELGGLESWFTPPTAPLRPLPKWKMAIATYLGVFPVAALLTAGLAPRLAGLNDFLRGAVFNACMVVLLTWIVMPAVTRLLYRWLHPEDRR